MRTELALLAFAKYPEPGLVKTRLAKVVGDELAAELYRHFVRLTLSQGNHFACAGRYAAFSPPGKKDDLAAMFPGPWHWFAQFDSPDLGAKIHHAVDLVLKFGHRGVITIGTDSPSLPMAFLDQAAEALEHFEVVLGPAEDGGYYLIALKSVPAALFEGIAWSTDQVLAQTLAAAKRLDLSVHLLPSWYDVDDLLGLQRLSRAIPLPGRLAAKLAPFLGE